MDAQVVNDREHRRFVLGAGSAPGELVYHERPGRLTLIHTEVPPEMRGQGVGGRLVQAALAYAREHGLSVIPECEYARGWLEQHPDAAAQVHVEWGSQG